LKKVMPSVRARGRTGMSQREVGKGCGGLPSGRMQDLPRFRRWPVAREKVDMAARRARTVSSVQAPRRATQSSAYCAAQMRCPATLSPTAEQVWSQLCRAQATKRYIAGASGQPWRTPASHVRGCETHPLTTAEARVSCRRVWAHPTMPAVLAVRPVPAVPSHMKGNCCCCCCCCCSCCPTPWCGALPPPISIALMRKSRSTVS